jgi:hypothetical protein
MGTRSFLLVIAWLLSSTGSSINVCINCDVQVRAVEHLEPACEPLPPLKHYEPPRAGRYRRRS